MCQKKSYCSREVDPCIQPLVKAINQLNGFKTLSSCCGHKTYQTTIIIKDEEGTITEFFSGIKLEYRKRNRFYKRDENGFYFIPELLICDHLTLFEYLENVFCRACGEMITEETDLSLW